MDLHKIRALNENTNGYFMVDSNTNISLEMDDIIVSTNIDNKDVVNLIDKKILKAKKFLLNPSRSTSETIDLYDMINFESDVDSQIFL